MNIDLYGLKTAFSQHLQELLRFKFLPFNPVFWIFFLILFLITLRFWARNKSFSFCIVVAAILLLSTKVEKIVVDFFARGKESFDPFLLRIATLVIILLTIIYYSFIKGEE